LAGHGMLVTHEAPPPPLPSSLSAWTGRKWVNKVQIKQRGVV